MQHKRSSLGSLPSKNSFPSFFSESSFNGGFIRVRWPLNVLQMRLWRWRGTNEWMGHLLARCEDGRWVGDAKEDLKKSRSFGPQALVSS